MGLQSRAPEARLLRARHLAQHWEETRASHRYEERVVWRYAKFLHDIQGLDPILQDRFFATSTEFSEVHSLLVAAGVAPPASKSGYEDQEGESRRLRVGPEQRDRGLIKALVVAEAPVEYIASQLSYSKKTIELFEYLAWDVRSRLKARGWVHNHLFAGGLFQETALADFEGMCVYSAYTGGLAAIERLLCLTPGAMEQEIEDLRSQFNAEIARKAMTAIRTLPLNSHTGPEVVTGFIQMNKHAQDVEIKRKVAGGGAGSGAGVAEMVSATVSGVAPYFTTAKSTVQSGTKAEEPRSSAIFQEALEAEVAQLEVAR